MANIIPKLNLNKTPSLVDSNSLVFAKNIRLDNDGTIHKDYGILCQSIKKHGNNLLDYGTIFERIIADVTNYINTHTNVSDIYQNFVNRCNIIKSLGDDAILTIVGVIPDNNDFYILLNTYYYKEFDNVAEERTGSSIAIDGDFNFPDITTPEETEEEENEGDIQTSDIIVFSNISYIVKYNKAENIYELCDCNWTYSGGEINGLVINNLRGEKILIIAEKSTSENAFIPLKCINLNKSSYKDDESIYTQTPDIPLINLNFTNKIPYNIPNGVYQFFIRYKIRKNFYTNWFPATRELYIGNSIGTVTCFGTLKYTDIHKSSNYSFQFDVEILNNVAIENYENFQIGFIVSTDDATYARAWKHFSFSEDTIKFDYNYLDAEEIEVTDLLRPTYQIYNVGNVTSFKNKLYISNYKESNFNEDLQETADNIRISIAASGSFLGYNNHAVTGTTSGNKYYIDAIDLGDNSNFISITGQNGVIYKTLTNAVGNNITVETLVTKCLSNATATNNGGSISMDLQGIHVAADVTSLEKEQNIAVSKIKKLSKYVPDTPIIFNNTIKSVKVNNTTITPINKNNILSVIYNTIKYINPDAQLVDLNKNLAQNYTVYITRQCTYKAYTSIIPINQDIQPISSDIPGSGGITTIEDRTYDYTQELHILLNGYKSLIADSNINYFVDFSTLIPYQHYKFYIHFIKKSGEITNGYLCSNAIVDTDFTSATVLNEDSDDKSEIIIKYRESANRIIYPIFENIQIPEGYVACFFTIRHNAIKAGTVKLSSLTTTSGGQTTVLVKEGTSVDVNLGVFSSANKLNIKQGNTIYEGSYYHSSDTDTYRYFGGPGIISISAEAAIDTANDAYVIDDYKDQDSDDIQLIRCTPFINKTKYDNYATLNLLGFICNYSPVDIDRAVKFFTDGSSIYYKSDNDVAKYQADTDMLSVKMTEVGRYQAETPSEQTYLTFNLKPTSLVQIYSNYNYNYLKLTDDIKIKYATYYPYPEGTPPANPPKGITTMLRLMPSLTMANVYELPSMYKNIVKKTYSKYKSDDVVIFDNTIRSSELLDDELSVDMFKFNSEDYYNVPTNRGIIVNLIAIGDGILVHTRDSMFKFTGNNNLVTTEGEITPNETEPFDTGISEIFGSDFGFAGLADRHHAIVTENAYIFYDKDANIVYAYSGQNQMVKLSDSIKELFAYKPIENIYFANDFYNNRFFMGIDYSSEFITLSYNFSDEAKAFISLHDFKFKKAFNTKVDCYFLKEDYSYNPELVSYKCYDDICYVEKSLHSIYFKLSTYDFIYPKSYKSISLAAKDALTNQDITITATLYASILDVINNTNYEIIKTLDYVEWSSSIVEKIFVQRSNSNPKTLMVADIKQLMLSEPETYPYPCDKIRIYTDTCCTDIIEANKISNLYSINNPNSYIYPRYNQGKWALNYFRNILNATDLFKYLTAYDDGRTNANLRSDENSLVEGKYVVVRFVFEDNYDFRLEKLECNFKNKL